MRLPVLRGPLRGTWWLPASGGKVLRVLLGTYEPDMTELFLRHVAPDGTFLDVGAHVGFYTLLAARRMAGEGRVWAFEPAPGNARYLRRHVRLNRASNVRVEETAVAGEDGTALFGGGSGTGTGRLTEEGEREVRTVALDSFCREHGIAPTAIKIDVEGAEVAVLRGGRDTLRTHRPVLFLSTHGPEPHAACTALLEDLGYESVPIRGGAGAPAAEALWRPAAG